MSEDDYKRGYRDGYKDGMKDARPPVDVTPPMFPYSPIPSVPYPPTWYPKSFGCAVCGLDVSGPLGYVCSRSDCPSCIKYTVTTAGSKPSANS